jgi:hypothetical protein
MMGVVMARSGFSERNSYCHLGIAGVRFPLCRCEAQPRVGKKGATVTRWAILALLSAGVACAAQTDIIQHWNQPVISSPNWESHPAFDPRSGDLWFVRSDKSFSGWHLLVAHCVRGSLTAPVAAPLARPGLEADPWFSPDGKTLWFISTRQTGSAKSADLDIYRVDRDDKGKWSDPVPLPAPVNSGAAEWFPRPAPDGWLYFGSRRTGGFGKDDIWRARQHGGQWLVENLGPEINTAADESEFQPSPDGQWGLLSTERGLVRVVATEHGWRRDRLLTAQNGSEIGPLISPDSKSYMFSRDAGDGASGELFIGQLSGGVGWAPRCPRSAASATG